MKKAGSPPGFLRAQQFLQTLHISNGIFKNREFLLREKHLETTLERFPSNSPLDCFISSPTFFPKSLQDHSVIRKKKRMQGRQTMNVTAQKRLNYCRMRYWLDPVISRET